MSLFSAFYDEGALVMSLPRIAAQYARTWMLFDVTMISMDWCFRTPTPHGGWGGWGREALNPSPPSLHENPKPRRQSCHVLGPGTELRPVGSVDVYCSERRGVSHLSVRGAFVKPFTRRVAIDRVAQQWLGKCVSEVSLGIAWGCLLASLCSASDLLVVQKS